MLVNYISVLMYYLISVVQKAFSAYCCTHFFYMCFQTLPKFKHKAQFLSEAYRMCSMEGINKTMDSLA